MKFFPQISLLVLSSVLCARLGAEDFFEDKVRPILAGRCVACHREGKADGGLRLDTHEGLLAGGKSGHLINESQPEKSLLLKAINEIHPKRPVRMPPILDAGVLYLWIKRDGASWGTTRKIEPSTTPEEALTDGLQGSEIKRFHARALAAANTAEPMKPYTELIPGTEIGIDMLPIPVGKFRMGSADTEKGRGADEGPVHEVEVEAFWMARVETTWNEFDLFHYLEEYRKLRKSAAIPQEELKLADALSDPSQPYVELSFGMGRDGYPVVAMSQHMANRYCQWLSVLTGHFYRLPTEAEWEYAARAGTTTAYYWGDDPAKAREYCWYGPNSDFKYHKVGTKLPNAWGLHDMLGNVAEWVADGYAQDFYSRSPKQAPWNAVKQRYPHSLRGGSWEDEVVSKLRCAAREKSSPDFNRRDPQIPKARYYDGDAPHVGFRVIRPLKVPSVEEMRRYWNTGMPPELGK